MSDWVNETVKDFGLLMGLNIEALPVTIVFEQRGQLTIERNGDGLLIILSRPMDYSNRDSRIRKALKLCYFKRQPAFTYQATLHGDNDLAFVTRLNGEAVTVSHLDQALTRLTQLHNQLV